MLPSDNNVVVADRNNPADAAKKVAAGMDGACAASGEADVYAFSARLLGLQVIRHIGAEVLDRRGPAGSCRLFLGPPAGFRLGACWSTADAPLLVPAEYP